MTIDNLLIASRCRILSSMSQFFYSNDTRVWFLININFYVSNRFPIGYRAHSKYNSFVMRNCCDLYAFNSRHVRRNCITYVAAAFFQTTLICYSAISRAACL